MQLHACTQWTAEHPRIGAHTSRKRASSESCRTSSFSAWFRWRAACSCRACSAGALLDDAMPPVASSVLQSARGPACSQAALHALTQVYIQPGRCS